MPFIKAWLSINGNIHIVTLNHTNRKEHIRPITYTNTLGRRLERLSDAGWSSRIFKGGALGIVMRPPKEED